ncbi:MAG: hypothetical protein ACLP1W_12890 [Rhodomicrobium sp.]
MQQGISGVFNALLDGRIESGHDNGGRFAAATAGFRFIPQESGHDAVASATLNLRYVRRRFCVLDYAPKPALALACQPDTGLWVLTVPQAEKHCRLHDSASDMHRVLFAVVVDVSQVFVTAVNVSEAQPATHRSHGKVLLAVIPSPEHVYVTVFGAATFAVAGTTSATAMAAVIAKPLIILNPLSVFRIFTCGMRFSRQGPPAPAPDNKHQIQALPCAKPLRFAKIVNDFIPSGKSATKRRSPVYRDQPCEFTSGKRVEGLVRPAGNPAPFAAGASRISRG